MPEGHKRNEALGWGVPERGVAEGVLVLILAGATNTASGLFALGCLTQTD